MFEGNDEEHCCFEHQECWLRSKESARNAGDVGSIPGSGRFPAEGYACLGNPVDRGLRSMGSQESDMT